MGIDWLTFTAQIINFLILVLLLQRFLYIPIVRAMDQRERKIASSLQDAEAKQQAATQEAERYHRLQQDWQKEQEDLRIHVKRDIDSWKQSLQQQARADLDRARQKWRDSLQQEQQAFLKYLRNAATQESYMVIRRALGDLANTSLERQIIGVFLERLKSLSVEHQQLLGSAGDRDQNSEPARAVCWLTVQSAFPLSDTDCRQIQQVVHDRLMAFPTMDPLTPGAAWSDMHFRFEVVPDLISGIELRANGFKLAWSLENYLTNLEDQVTAAFDGTPTDHATK